MRFFSHSLEQLYQTHIQFIFITFFVDDSSLSETEKKTLEKKKNEAKAFAVKQFLPLLLSFNFFTFTAAVCSCLLVLYRIDSLD